MAKKKQNIAVFPLLALITPSFLFLLQSLLRAVRGGTFTAESYKNHFVYLFDVLKNFTEYLFPCLFYFTCGLLCLALNRFFTKAPLKKGWWIFLSVTGTLLILMGSRFLFLYANQLLFSPKALDFLNAGINMYTVTAALISCFLTNFLLQLLDVFYFHTK